MGPGGGTSKERCSGLRAGIQRAATRTSSDPQPAAHRQHLSGLGAGRRVAGSLQPLVKC